MKDLDYTKCCKRSYHDPARTVRYSELVPTRFKSSFRN
jgi:hypothetical protein